ncbi:MAG TPA: hypothetical protein VK022_03445 [Paracoccaceae bacterium]|nr:hypothetical protein [Paracoccaceae bacterium]
MATCDTCGNSYDKTFEVRTEEATYTFDCFECAIHKLAPTCEICGVRIIGHGVEAGKRIFCCAHCAVRAGESGMRDRI